MIFMSMGAIDTEKAELACYQLKDIAKSWYKMWQDSKPLGRVPVMWKMFKIAFLERFFPKDMMEAKIEELISLKLGSITVMEYSLKFVRLSRYDTSLVSNTNDEMSRFPTGIT